MVVPQTTTPNSPTKPAPKLGKTEKTFNKAMNITDDEINIDQFLTELAIQRSETRMSARNLQQTGNKIGKYTEKAVDTTADAVNLAGNITGASNSAHGAIAMSAINIGMFAAKTLGVTVGNALHPQNWTGK